MRRRILSVGLPVLVVTTLAAYLRAEAREGQAAPISFSRDILPLLRAGWCLTVAAASGGDF